MPQTGRKSNHVDRDEAQRLYAELKSYREVAKHLNSNSAKVYRTLNPDKQTPSNGIPPAADPPTALQPIEHVGEVSAEQSSADSADLRAQLAALKAQVDDLQAHRLEVDAWIQAFQRQAVQSRAVQSRALQEPAQSHMFLDPEDAKPERWNLWVPRGLKRLIDARAKASGLAPSQLVQRWLWQVFEGEEGER